MLAPAAQAGEAPSPAADCMAVHAFTLAMLVVILPLFALHAFEQRRRAALRQLQRQRLAAAEQAARWRAAAPGPSGSGDRGGGGLWARQRAGARSDVGSSTEEEEEEGQGDDWWRDGAEPAAAAAGSCPDDAAAPQLGTTLLHLYLCSCTSWTLCCLAFQVP